MVTRRVRIACLLTAAGALAWLKAWGSSGTDIHVYLHAAGQLRDGADIYADNPYNRYLYSPLFAMLMQPLAGIDGLWARFAWLVINGLAGLRVWILFRRLVAPVLPALGRGRSILAAGVLLFALDAINMNFNLGQITLLVLWLTVEGCLLILGGRSPGGAALLALGINIKILPVLAVGYLLLKRAYRGVVLTAFFAALLLVVPALQVGWAANVTLHQQWFASVNPSQAQYVFETDNGCESLSCVLTAYLLAPAPGTEDVSHELHRKIAHLDPPALQGVIQAARLVVVLSLVAVLLRGGRTGPRTEPHTAWELSLLLVVSLLVFPHQMRYSMAYAAPAAAWILLFATASWSSRSAWRRSERLLLGTGLVLIVLVAIQGRDLIGGAAVDIFRFFHLMGLAALAFFVALSRCRPSRLEDLLPTPDRDAVGSMPHAGDRGTGRA